MPIRNVMGLFKLFLNLLYFSLHMTQNCPEKGISSYRVLNDNGLRLTTLNRGNYTIQGLMTFTDNDCENVNQKGLVRVYTIRYAIDKANKNKSLIPWGKVGYQLDSLCHSLSRTMSRGMEVVSLHRPNSVCRADFLKCDQKQNITFDVKPAIAVVGTLRSVSSIPLASLMALYNIPQISASATSRILSKKDLYKSFFRTIPSDTNQVTVMLDIIEKFEWNYVFAIGSDDDYGKLGIAELKQNSHARNVCVTNDEYISADVDAKKEDIAKKVEEVTDKIKKEHNAKVVILFCYASIGKKIFLKAEEKGIKRVWLTSESWKSYALSMVKGLKNQSIIDALRNQLVGVMTVSLETYNMSYMHDYIERDIRENFKCDMWLQNFMHKRFKCIPTNITSDGATLYGIGTGCPRNVSYVVKKLWSIPATTQNLVDAVSSLIYAIHNHLESVCSVSSALCSEILPRHITEQLFNVTFINEQGNRVSFNKYGNPKKAYYTVENIKLVNGSLEYVPVGNWCSTRNGHKLQIDVEHIQWPLWFDPEVAKMNHPFSRCNADCSPGYEMAGEQLCCWKCQKCVNNTYSDNLNARSCDECPKGYHTTLDHTNCKPTPIKWLTIYDPVGTSIVIISGMGLLISFIASCILIYYRNLINLGTTSPHIITLCCILLHITFGYGAILLVKPSDVVCLIVNAMFFLLLMAYTSMVMIRTKFFSNYLVEHIEKWVCGQLFCAQMLSFLFFIIIEVVSIALWFHMDTIHVMEFIVETKDVYEKHLMCACETPWRYVPLFIPIIILIIASFCAFRERNMDHSFHEPKFLSFACIALCIIIIAYIPTYEHGTGKYKAVTVVITMDLFAFTFMSCLIMPKVYVALMRHKGGAEMYPVRPGILLPQSQQSTLRLSSTHNLDVNGTVQTSFTTQVHLPPDIIEIDDDEEEDTVSPDVVVVPAIEVVPAEEDCRGDDGCELEGDVHVENSWVIDASEVEVKENPIVNESDLSLAQGYDNGAMDLDDVN